MALRISRTVFSALSATRSLSNRDVAIGTVLALALGFDLLFLHYYTAFATQATAVLFGNVLAVDRQTIATLAVLGIITLIALGAIMRPLIFASLQPERKCCRPRCAAPRAIPCPSQRRPP